MRYLAVVLLLMLSLPVQALTLEEWGSWQASTPAFQSQIEQSRWLEEAEIRVHATGHLLFTPYQPLVLQWLTPEPRLMELDKTGQLLDLRSPEGASVVPPLEESDDNLPGEQQMVTLLLSALSGDLAALETNYHLMLEGDRDAWQLILLPRERGESTPRKITLEGGRFVTTLGATTSESNELVLELSDHHRLVDAKGARVLATALRKERTPERRDEDEDDEDDDEDDDD
ncbi:hypothetical protein SAMN02745148_02064 [Modicisalibacter ilicicola DSM 19980]|uniref:Outer membrane lipoprotein carrier protein LolA n=1 Tax=Modicisalibacter ilicicola DSM 19980 TaxID=1121942 RepID=A0A1M4ZUD0_9GAMM|nr:hypothetical protein [Halomonas ilicicola]SHF21629.1 hypothetical protein SAMN02745148_02064 [Halomonas ilicicola DSM 19980]